MGMKRIGGVMLGILLCGVVGCTTANQPPTPQAITLRKGAAVLVVDSSIDGIESSEESLRRRVLTHALTLGSPMQVRMAMGKPAVAQTNWFAQTADPDERAAWLIEHLRVEPVPGTALIQLDVSGVSDRLEQAAILQQLVETYFDRLKKERTAALMDETTVLNNRRIAAEMRWSDINKEMRDKRLKIGFDGGGDSGVKAAELAVLIREQVEVQLAWGRARAEYEAAVEASSNGKRPAGIEEAVSADLRLRRLRDALDDAQTTLDEARVSSTDQNPTVIAARRKVEAMNERVKKVYDELLAETSARRLADLKQASEVQMSRLEGISKRVDNLRMDIGELANAQAQLRLLEEEASKVREQIFELKQKVSRIMAQVSSSQVIDVRWYLRPE